jgi:coproporphyrinogen III oxidase-like Fe-S oxidoreductase
MPGCRSRHNQVYWANHAHFGLGMGAASYVRGVRRLNTRDLSSYLRRLATGRPAHFQEEELPPRERALETVATQLRRLDGIDRAAFTQQTGFPLDALLGPALSDLVGLRLLEDDGHHVRLTRAGLCVADEVIRNVFKLESRL